MSKILVTYASRTGWTPGVAETIGKVFGEGGDQVDVLPMEKVGDLSSYQVVVAGSAIQNKQWLPEALQFIRTHQAELARKPFAAFLVCLTLAMKNGEAYRPMVQEFMAPVRRLVKPVSEGCFAGGLEVRRLPSLGSRINFRLSILIGIWEQGDHRDWDAIRSWAEELRKKLPQSGS